MSFSVLLMLFPLVCDAGFMYLVCQATEGPQGNRHEKKRSLILSYFTLRFMSAVAVAVAGAVAGAVAVAVAVAVAGAEAVAVAVAGAVAVAVAGAGAVAIAGVF